MSYIEIKKIKGRYYRYKRTSYREGNKIKHKSKYLDAVNPVQTRRKCGGRKPILFVRKISSRDKSKLHKASRSSLSFTKDRAKIILLSSQKLYAKQIAEKISCEVRKVRNAIKLYNKRGINSLERGKAKGAKPKFTESKKKIILSHFAREPINFGYHFTTWTLPRFRIHLIKKKVVESISIETVRQIIYKAGGKLKRSKRRQYSPDKEFDKKNKKLSKL